MSTYYHGLTHCIDRVNSTETFIFFPSTMIVERIAQGKLEARCKGINFKVAMGLAWSSKKYPFTP